MHAAVAPYPQMPADNTAVSDTTMLVNSSGLAKRRERHAQVLLCGELPVTSDIVTASMPQREELEQFVIAMFKKAHQAEIHQFMPTLLSLRDSHQQLRAVCGLRHAHHAPLFLERYLSQPVESVLSARVGQQVSRSDILEVGNLAVVEPACIRSLLASVSVYLHSTEANWAVFTGIKPLRNALLKLHMPLVELGEASIDCLAPEERAAWGKYYEQGPLVMAIPRMQA